ncbi:AAA family ATPase [Actinokineospora sp. 24-640]
MADALSTPVTLVTGPAGTGRTTLLAEVAERTAGTGGFVAGMRFARTGEALPARFELVDGQARVRTAGPAGAVGPWTPVGPVAGARHDPEVAARGAAVAAGPLLRAGRGVVLVDDVHWADADSVAVLAALAREVAGSGVRCVCAARTPAPVATPRVRALVARLRAEGLLESVRLGPLPRRTVARLLAEELRATPEPALVDQVLAVTRGVPAAVRAVVNAVRESDSLRVVDRWAYLTGPLPRRAGHLAEAVRDLGPGAWAAAKALAVVHPLGPGVPDLVAEDGLDLLVSAGVAHRGLGGRSWRFTIPVVGDAVAAAAGPFERAGNAAAAVSAVWSGAARCDPGAMAALSAWAGPLLDPERAARELLDHADDRPEALAAAFGLAREPRTRVAAGLRLTAARHADGDHAESLRLASALLGGGGLASDDALLSRITIVESLFALGDTAAVAGVASSTWEWPDAADPGPEVAARALALLDRWTEVGALSEDTGLLGTAGLWCGLPGPPPSRTALLVAGEPAPRAPVARGPGLHDEVMAAAARGEADRAVDLARRVAAEGGHRYGLGCTAALHTAVSLLVAQGRLTTARALLDSGGPAPLGHLRDLGEAVVAAALGDWTRATARLRTALSFADKGVLVGLELCWSELAAVAVATGNRAVAAQALRGVERVATALATGRAELHLSMARATVSGDRAAGDACLRVARERGQPAELAAVVRRLVEHGGADPRLLLESYDLLGGTGALLHRSWTRTLMRERGVPVPGRRETAAENELLLARLTAGGLSNRDLAAVLRTSTKSVEGGLSRLFTRTGYRSRIELSTAILTGEYRPKP